MKTTILVFSALITLVLASCTTSNTDKIVSEKVYRYNGKRYIQQRILRSTHPYETELRTVQLR